MFPDPEEAPFGGSAFCSCGSPDIGDFLRGFFGETPSSQRFHHHYPETFFGGILYAAGPPLKVDVHIVILDLAEFPAGVGINNFFKGVKGVMERKAGLADASFE